MQAYAPDSINKTNVIIFETYTIVAEKADDFAASVAKEFGKEVEWVVIGDFFPVVLNGALHYTFTVRGGTLV